MLASKQGQQHQIAFGFCKENPYVERDTAVEKGRIWCENGAMLTQALCKDGAALVRPWCEEGAAMILSLCL